MAPRADLGTSRWKSGKALAESYPISIIIPAHNSAPFLADTLEALLANDLDCAEVIVVDDCSFDGTLQLLHQFEGQRGIKVLRLDQRAGPSGARNQGARAARYDYLFFLDADILVPSRALSWFRESLEVYSHRPEVVGVLGCYATHLPFNGFFSHFKNLSTAYLYRITETRSPFLHSAIMLVRKRVFEEAGGFDSELRRAEDFEMGLVLGSRGFRFVIDRRIQGVHLKRYSLKGILSEDWHRIRSLLSLRLTSQERCFSYQAHRVSRMVSLALPGPILILAGFGLVGIGYSLFAAALLTAVFAVANLAFLRFLRRNRGWRFATLSGAFLFVEMAWAEIAVMIGLLVVKRRRRPPQDEHPYPSRGCH